MTIEPSELAEQLPNRPLTSDEIADLSEAFGWSVNTESYKTENGTIYVPRWFAFRMTDQGDESPMDDVGDAIVLYMDDEMTRWTGTVDKEGVTRRTWMQVNEAYAAEMGAEREVQYVETERGIRDLSEEE